MSPFQKPTKDILESISILSFLLRVPVTLLNTIIREKTKRLGTEKKIDDG